MPKLLAFLPCENVLTSDQNTTSLITILEVLNINIPPEQEAALPPNTQLPRPWFIFTLWQELAEEKGREFEQRIEFVAPDKPPHQLAVMEIKFRQDQPRHRTIVSMGFFPILPAGTCYLKSTVREKGTQYWLQPSEYPILITRNPE